VCHGGLFRKPPAPALKKRSRAQQEGEHAEEADDDAAAERLQLSRLGSLEDLRADKREHEDPGEDDDTHASRLASDVVWSDPAAQARAAVASLMRPCDVALLSARAGGPARQHAARLRPGVRP
jgi:hypothetical protein